jgi:hypothetical protein
VPTTANNRRRVIWLVMRCVRPGAAGQIVDANVPLQRLELPSLRGPGGAPSGSAALRRYVVDAAGTATHSLFPLNLTRAFAVSPSWPRMSDSAGPTPTDSVSRRKRMLAGRTLAPSPREISGRLGGAGVDIRADVEHGLRAIGNSSVVTRVMTNVLMNCARHAAGSSSGSRRGGRTGGSRSGSRDCGVGHVNRSRIACVRDQRR